MRTRSAILTNERQASNTRPAVLGTTGRLLSAYDEKIRFLVDMSYKLTNGRG